MLINDMPLSSLLHTGKMLKVSINIKKHRYLSGLPSNGIFMILTCHCVQNAMHLARAAVVSSSKNAALPTYKSCQRNDHRLLVS